MRTDSHHQPWLHRYAVFCAAATIGLIGLGGLVTSKGVGMAVPDWPTTFGYNMFLFPVSQWVGGIFYEHTHRLYASAVGLLTVGLALWMQLREPRAWVRRLGWLAVGLVAVQGTLGGLRVSLMKDVIGVFHGALAQAFLILLALIALFTSRRWLECGPWAGNLPAGRLARTGAVLAGLVFAQLLLGAVMRHQHAGLAVPDFPLAYGRIYPPTSPEFLQGVNALRADVRDFHPIRAWHVHVHMVHRLLAFVILAGIWLFARSARRDAAPAVVRRLSALMAVLVAVQVLLGAWTVWSNKAADIATLHVVIGATLLVAAVLAAAWSRRLAAGALVKESAAVMTMNPVETGRAGVAASPT
ncbi:MAG: COX15/CtaA family protein [Limisphaerales bacterium]